MGQASCPRCDVPLSERLGALHEDVCGACQGRFVHPENAQRVLTDELGHDPAFLRELSEHFAGEPIECPGCASKMSAITLRGVPLELCQGCGGMWLDKGELSRLTADRYREVGADPPPAPPAPPSPPAPEVEAEPVGPDGSSLENPLYKKGAAKKVLPAYILAAAALGFMLSLPVAAGQAAAAFGIGALFVALMFAGYIVGVAVIPSDFALQRQDRRTFFPSLGCLAQSVLFFPILLAGLSHVLVELAPQVFKRWFALTVFGCVALMPLTTTWSDYVVVPRSIADERREPGYVFEGGLQRYMLTASETSQQGNLDFVFEVFSDGSFGGTVQAVRGHVEPELRGRWPVNGHVDDNHMRFGLKSPFGITHVFIKGGETTGLRRDWGRLIHIRGWPESPPGEMKERPRRRR